MKIVINKDFGGFGLSNEAMQLYLKKKGQTVFSKCTDYGMKYFYTSADMNEDSFISEHDIPRNDPALVEVVEELGSAANGSYAYLKVIEIPDDVEWVIEEYDGAEWVAEVHRTWR